MGKVLLCYKCIFISPEEHFFLLSSVFFLCMNEREKWKEWGKITQENVIKKLQYESIDKYVKFQFFSRASYFQQDFRFVRVFFGELRLEKFRDFNRKKCKVYLFISFDTNSVFFLEFHAEFLNYLFVSFFLNNVKFIREVKFQNFYQPTLTSLLIVMKRLQHSLKPYLAIC